MPVAYAENIDLDELVGKLGKTPSILIGNGMSIAFDKSFQYQDLLQKAEEHGLSQESLDVFDHLDTRNFEQVMRGLDDAAFIAETFHCTCQVADRIRSGTDETKKMLIKAITDVHGNYRNTKSVPEPKKIAAVDLLSRFDNVYTLNYDFLLYWAWVHGVVNMQAIHGKDGFRHGAFTSPLDDGIHYLHGGLHLYTEMGQVHKIHYNEQGDLLQHVLDGFAKGRYPLFISEGDYKKKLRGIRQSQYLSAAFDSFSLEGEGIATFGTELGAMDHHLVEAMGRNRNLKHVYLGSYSWPASQQLKEVAGKIEALRAKAGAKPLESLVIYNQAKLEPWGP